MKHRRIPNTDGAEVYYVPVDVVNVADNLHVTDNNPVGGLRGYGGSTLNFDMDDGTVDKVKGPWHTNSTGFYRDTGINVGELHLTKLTIWDDQTEEVIYQEKEPVLGPFYRGDRIAQQLAVVRNRAIRVHSESNGGSSTKTCYPDGRYTHPLSRRKEDNNV